MASTIAIPEAAARRLVLFRLAGRTYGIDLEVVREILPFRRSTRLPGAPPYVSGLINVRGSIVTVIDLGPRLDASAPASADGSIILIDHGGKVVGVGVDEVMDVQLMASEAMEAAGSEDGSVRGLGRLGDKVVIILDIHAIVKQVLL